MAPKPAIISNQVSWRDGLDGPHLRIAESDRHRIGVLAGPGTGKTSYGLMRRVARLLEEEVPPGEILLISFTRTAAHDLRTKIANLGVAGAEEVRATTLHAYCFGLLRTNAVLEITRRTPRPLLDHEVDMMLRDLPGDFGDIFERRRLLHAFEADWARAATDHPGLADPNDEEFERLVLRWLRHHKAMLVGEVVPIAHAYLRDNPAAGEHTRYKHVVVDEYQDLNALEQQLLDLLAKEASLCIAGDDDQSIYGFRYANPEGIRLFRDRDEVEEIDIGVCGRCPGPILDMANELISHAPGREKTSLEVLDERDGEVAIVQWNDLDEEIDGLSAGIAGAIERGEREAGDILILVHRQEIGEGLRRRLKELDVPAQSFFQQESVSSDEAQHALALLRMAVAEDRPSLRVILGLGDAKARADAYRRLTDLCRNENKSEHEILDALIAGEHLPIKVPAFLKRYKAAKAFLEGLPRENLEEAVDHLFPPDVEEIEDLRAIALEEMAEADDLSILAERIVERVTQHDVPETPDFVRIMSLHKSKGLTSPVVFVASMVDGIVPTLPSRLTEEETEASYDEQRRLVFVAITRASEELVLSSALKMELGLAKRLGVEVVKSGIRKIGEHLVAPTVATPYLDEMTASAPKPVRGVDWVARH